MSVDPNWQEQPTEVLDEGTTDLPAAPGKGSQPVGPAPEDGTIDAPPAACPQPVPAGTMDFQPGRTPPVDDPTHDGTIDFPKQPSDPDGTVDVPAGRTPPVDDPNPDATTDIPARLSEPSPEFGATIDAPPEQRSESAADSGSAQKTGQRRAVEATGAASAGAYPPAEAPEMRSGATS